MVENTQEYTLRQGIPFAIYYTMVLSVLGCMSSALQIFNAIGAPKLIGVFFNFFYLWYILVSIKLNEGIRSRQRDKFTGWIVLSFNMVFFQACGIFYFIVVLSKMNRLEDSDLFRNILIGTVTLSVLITLVLLYCMWGVSTLWRIYGKDRADGIPVEVVTS